MKQEIANVVARIGRNFQNSKGDWEKLEKLSKEISTYADVIDGLCKDLVEANTRLRKLMVDAYHLSPEIDCLFYDSPISPAKQSLHLRAYLHKLGFDGIRDVITNPVDIKPFSFHIKEGVQWLLKLKPVKKTKE
jgi:hypothetical protein